MATLAYTPIPSTGVALAASLSAADAAGDTFPVDSNKLFVVTNSDTSAHTVTITAPVASTVCGSYGQLAVEDKVITVAAGETQMFTIPLGYGDANLFTLTYDAITDVTVGGFALSVNA